MRHAYPGQHGYGPYNAPGTAHGAGSDSDRLSNLKRAIESIEQRMAPAFPQTATPVSPPSQLEALQEQINRLSNQIGAQGTPFNAGPTAHAAAAAPASAPFNDDIAAAAAQIAQRQQALNLSTAPVGAPAMQPATEPQQNSTASVAHQQMAEAATMRTQVANKSMEIIAKQLKDLKGELTGIKQEIAKPVEVKQPGVASEDITRIADAIAELQRESQPDESAFDRLSQELEAMRASMKSDLESSLREHVEHGTRSADAFQQSFEDRLHSLTGELDALARGVESVSQEVGTVSRSMDAVAQGVDTVSQHAATTVTPRVEELSQQLVALRETVNALPQALPDALAPTLAAALPAQDASAEAVARLEDQLSEIATKIEDLSAAASTPSAPAVDPAHFANIEGRLDEIARALVAVSNMGKKQPQAPAVDLTPIDRLEARMSDLGRAVDAMATASMQAINENAESVAAVANQHNPEIEALSVRIEGLVDRLGSFEKYAQSGDLGGASAMFAAPDTGVIEEQLRQLSAKVDSSTSSDQIAALEQQLAHIAVHMEQVAANPQIDSLEDQLKQLAARVEEAAAVNSTAAQMSNLEAQVGQILRKMNKQPVGDASGMAVDFAPVEARLGEIEAHLAGSQGISLEAAQQAAQQAVAMMGTDSQTGQALEALSQDLKTLQLLTENGHSESLQASEQVQQTMQQVVDRLGSLESTVEHSAAATGEQLEAHLTHLFEAHGTLAQPAHVEPAAVAAAPLAMPETAYQNDQAGPEQAFVAPEEMPAQAVYEDAPVTQAYSASGAPMPSPMPTVESPSIDPRETLEAAMQPQDGGATPMSAEDNVPLEPGSPVPDLEQKSAEAPSHVLDEPAPVVLEEAAPEVVAEEPIVPSGEVPTDAVAAARRALQHTKEEMSAVREEAKAEKAKGGDLKSRINSLLANPALGKVRKPLIIAAAAVLLAWGAFQGYSMFAGSPEQPVAKVEAPAKMAANETKAAQPSSEGNGPTVVSESTPRTIEIGDPKADGSGSGTATTNVQSIVEADSDNAAAKPESSAAAEPAAPQSVAAAPTEPTEKPVTADEKPAQTAPASANATYSVPANAGPAALVAAASNGDPKALFHVGMRYSEGNGTARNMAQSAKWFEASAETGFAPAQYSIGSLYEKGIGVKRDTAKAAEWYQKAADQGNARAMHNLAVIRAMGNPPSVKPNMETAVTWFTKAAALGIKDSQFNLGILYGQGMGVPQNLTESYKWFALAAKTGDTDAGKKRDEVANAMVPKDLDAARKLVREWKPQKLNEEANRVSVPAEWQGKAASSSAKLTQKQGVKLAQTLLNQRGFQVGAPDGVIGPKTVNAIKQFQRSAGIPVTGKVDARLLDALKIQT